MHLIFTFLKNILVHVVTANDLAKFLMQHQNEKTSASTIVNFFVAWAFVFIVYRI